MTELERPVSPRLTLTTERPSSPLLGFAIWFAVTVCVIWAIARLFGLERGSPFVQLMAFTPYVALAAAVPALVAVLARRWRAVAVATVACLALAACVLPRAIGSPSDLDGVPLRILSSNMLRGDADAQRLVELVRERNVDVLALQEFTPGAQRRLLAAGLATLLPYAEAHPHNGVAGSAIFARFPLTDGAVKMNAGGAFRQASATLHADGAAAIRIESVHPVSPSDATTVGYWVEEMRGQTPAPADGPPQVLAGDFNATLDHAELRRLLDTGYRDAADEVGDGLTPTWPYAQYRGIPPVTIDHVLVEPEIGVRDFAAVTIDSTDHRAILATLVLPRAE